MRRQYYFGWLTVLVASVLFGCGDSSMNTANTTNRGAMNSNMGNGNSIVGNAVNTVSNTVGNMTTASPSDFMIAAAQGGMTEVELGKIAAKKAQNAEVKKYGQMMVDDHSKANAELKALAAKKNVMLPADVGSSHKSTIDELNALSGAEFDAAYVDAMVEDHENDVEEFEEQAQSSGDPDVKAFAAKTLPTLKKHLDAIKAIQAKMP